MLGIPLMMDEQSSRDLDRLEVFATNFNDGQHHNIKQLVQDTRLDNETFRWANAKLVFADRQSVQ